jgi:hypothetical protein
LHVPYDSTLVLILRDVGFPSDCAEIEMAFNEGEDFGLVENAEDYGVASAVEVDRVACVTGEEDALPDGEGFDFFSDADNSASGGSALGLFGHDEDPAFAKALGAGDGAVRAEGALLGAIMASAEAVVARDFSAAKTAWALIA